MFRHDILESAKPLLAKGSVLEVALDMADNFESAVKEAEEGRVRLLGELHDFKTWAKNDVASIRAVGAQIREETRKVSAAITAAVTILNSTEMKQAVANASSLLAALTAMQELKTSRLTFAVIDSQPKEEVA